MIGVRHEYIAGAVRERSPCRKDRHLRRERRRSAAVALKHNRSARAIGRCHLIELFVFAASAEVEARYDAGDGADRQQCTPPQD
jgi:hypothetical protein